MDFNSLMAKMRELDQPVTQSIPATEACGDAPMPMSMPPAMDSQPPPSHPSMSVNLNAQGMDNIESLIKLSMSYPPRARALLGAIIEEKFATAFDLSALKSSLNPTTVYKLKIKDADFPTIKNWNIK